MNELFVVHVFSQWYWRNQQKVMLREYCKSSLSTGKTDLYSVSPSILDIAWGDIGDIIVYENLYWEVILRTMRDAVESRYRGSQVVSHQEFKEATSWPEENISTPKV